MNTNSGRHSSRGSKSGKWETSVNRSLREALSRSPSPNGSDRASHGHHDRPDPRYERGNGGRKDYRSGYRGDGVRGGDSRRRDLSEEERYERRDYRRGNSSNYRSYDRRQENRDRLPYGEDETRGTPKRGQSRSRSPRRDIHASRYRVRDEGRGAKDFESNRGSSQFQSSGNIARRNDNAMSSDENSGKPSKPLRGSFSDHESRRHLKSATESNTALVQPTSEDVTMIEDIPETAPEPEPEPESQPEEVSIEERRRRREAIKAKYKNTGADLRVQALEASSFAPKTPASDAETPARSLVDSTEVSGVSRDGTPSSPEAQPVDSDSELMNKLSKVGAKKSNDESSAAGFDPTSDMKEEQTRQQKSSATSEELSAKAYDETKADDRELPKSSARSSFMTAEERNKSAVKDDMFAEDEEDYDMFHSSPELSRKPTKAVPEARKAKILHVSMLDNWDDAEGYYKTNINELLDGRYHVKKNLGKGVFASVIQAEDQKTGQLVAIKMVRNQEAMKKAGAKEMQILQALAEADPDDKKHIVRLYRSFNHKSHLCMVFEHLSINLREVLKKFGYDIGLNLKAVRAYAAQMFLALAHLRKCEYIHADLKPDNMLVNEDRTKLKICDLGSATEIYRAEVAGYLASRFYRAPEVMLGIKYDYAIDMWSVGCTLYELYTGKILFPGPTNNQMLRLIMECRGKIHQKFLKQGEFTPQHFEPDLDTFRSLEDDKYTGRKITRLLTFGRPTSDLKSKIDAASTKTVVDYDAKELQSFVDLLERCLSLHPDRRIQPLDALKHPFIERNKNAFKKV